MKTPLISGTTVAHVFDSAAQAEVAVQRLRAAGFADVRVSERSGKTAEAHVPPQAGLTEIDFAQSLAAAGFDETTASEIVRAIARGAVLVTVAAGQHTDDARAVLRGETVVPRTLAPIDPVPGDRVIPLHAEEVQIEREPVESEARIRREVVTHEKTITVPVRSEELVVERDGADPVRIPLTEPD